MAAKKLTLSDDLAPRTTTSEIHRYKANATDKRTLTQLTQKGQ